jgi:MYXO-CTERM domain-containing protein
VKLLAVLLLLSSPAFAYVRSTNTNDLCIWWYPRGHGFQIDVQGTPDVSNEASFAAIRKSFVTWSDASCTNLTFQDDGLSSGSRAVGYFPGQANSNLILFRTRSCSEVVPAGDPCLAAGGCSNTYDCWDHGDAAIATTTTTSVSSTGQIQDTDTEFNDAPQSDGRRFTFTANDGPPCSTPNQTGCVLFDIQNTMTHEAGHSLGLAHSADSAAAMFATAPAGETSKRVLGADDLQGICAIYPLNAKTVTCAGDPDVLAAQSSGGCGCSHTQAGPGATLGVLIGLVAAHRRRRRGPFPKVA